MLLHLLAQAEQRGLEGVGGIGSGRHRGRQLLDRLGVLRRVALIMRVSEPREPELERADRGRGGEAGGRDKQQRP
ncbi:hypothetical protein [Amycolatopsis vastitatis]|uniref:hypothetical protein n=1 Tax=Amycolatopsis vastitatis TaxID=1905142 RepID=UPI001178B42D|nr:hypothetical protein [Amycolatopsis vastitatis]